MGAFCILYICFWGKPPEDKAYERLHSEYVWTWFNLPPYIKYTPSIHGLQGLIHKLWESQHKNPKKHASINHLVAQNNMQKVKWSSTEIRFREPVASKSASVKIISSNIHRPSVHPWLPRGEWSLGRSQRQRFWQQHLPRGVNKAVDSRKSGVCGNWSSAQMGLYFVGMTSNCHPGWTVVQHADTLALLWGCSLDSGCFSASDTLTSHVYFLFHFSHVWLAAALINLVPLLVTWLKISHQVI